MSFIYHSILLKDATTVKGRTPLNILGALPALERRRNYNFLDQIGEYFGSVPVKVSTEKGTEPYQPSAELVSKGTHMEEEDIDALHQLLQDKGVKSLLVSSAGNKLTLERVRQHCQLHEADHRYLARDLPAKLKAVVEKQKGYLQQLQDLMTDKETLNFSYLKIFLVGPPFVGKTTTLDRLLKNIKNIESGDNMRAQSTLLANCTQVSAFVDNDTVEWSSSKDLNEETKLIFKCLSCATPKQSFIEIQSGRCKSSICRDREATPLMPNKTVTGGESKHGLNLVEPHDPQKVKPSISELHSSHDSQSSEKISRINDVIQRLQKLIKTVDSSKESHIGGTLLNINDIGGQPGFLEMLPALSSGPAIYLVFSDLSKELNKSYKIPFSRDDISISPYGSVCTVRSTISQILSSIESNNYLKPQIIPDQPVDFREKFQNFCNQKPKAILVCTHKDKLKDSAGTEIKARHEALKALTKNYKAVINPSPVESFFAVDNFSGTETTDIKPIRTFLNTAIRTHFKEASLPIRPKWLILGVILRKEFCIVSMKNCLEIGKQLEMSQEEVCFCLWYHHQCTGTLMYYPEIADKWFKDHIICSPQVVFDSISQLIVASLHSMHSEESTESILEDHRKDWIKKGLFSLESIENYSRNPLVSTKLESEQLIPANKLVILLQHINLLSPITQNSTTDTSIKYLMPAVLEYIPPDKIASPPQPDDNNPEPLFIVFNCGYVPTGTFCGLITRLVSLGTNKMFGFTWKLVEENVKRNYISFCVGDTNIVTLLSHEKCYEVRVTRGNVDFSLHDLCSNVLSVIIRTIRSLVCSTLEVKLAFQCSSDYKSIRDINNLCTLEDDQCIQFVCCGNKPIFLRKSQLIWLGEFVSLDHPTQVAVLQQLTVDFLSKFTFKWSKVGKGATFPGNSDQPNVLNFQKVGLKDLGYYRCEVKEAKTADFTLYRALYSDDSSDSASGISMHAEDQLEKSDANRTESNQTESRAMQSISRETDREIRQQDLSYLANFFDSVELYLNAMELSPAEKGDVRRAVGVHGTQVGMMQCLERWRGHNPSTATFGGLLDMLLRLKKDDVAVKVREYMNCSHV